MKIKILILFTGILIITNLLSCKSTHTIATSEVYENPGEMVAAADAVVDHISMEELSESIENGEDFYLIDVRSAGEFEEGAIPGAVSVPRGVLEFVMFNDEFWEELNMDTPEKTDEIILYCRSGNRSVLAAKSLMQLGFMHVRSMDGGWKAWKSEEN